MQNDTMPTMVYDLVQSDVFFDWVTQFALSHKEIDAPGTFRVSDSLYADFSRYIEESGFTYNRRSDEIINLLRRVAQMEGYLEDAEAEMKALELKFAPNLKKDLERMKPLVLPYLESDIVLRYYHQKGSIRHALPNDKAYLEAVSLLRNAEGYRAILEAKDK
jgi:carboxyl-terminal processing protease